MAQSRLQLSRILFIDRELRSKRYPSSTRLAREYEVSSRTIQRDIEYMRDQMDAPIEYDQIKKGYFYTEEAFHLPLIDLTERDLFAVCVAEKAVGQYAGTPLYERLKDIFDRMTMYLPETVSVKASWLDDRISFAPESFTEVDPQVWESAARALQEQHRLHIRHCKAGETCATERDVDPYHLVHYRGEWYLIAHDHRREKVLRFAMSRIENAEILRETFTVPDGFLIDEFIGSHYGIMSDSRNFRVRVKFSQDQAPYVRERTWHAGQEITDEPDGGCVLEFPAASLFEVKRWVLSWGKDALVLEPKELRELVREELVKAGENYR